MPDIAHEVRSVVSTDFVARDPGRRADRRRARASALPVWFRLVVILGVAMGLWAAIAVALHWVFAN